MGYFNKVMLMGNVTRDPELRVLPSDTKVCDFGLAANRKYRTANGEDREETLFVDCAAFGRAAEVIHEFVTKGKPLFVEGRLKYDTWEDKTTGAKRNKLSVVVETFQFIGVKEGPMTPGGNASGSNDRTSERRSGSGGGASGGGGKRDFRKSDAPRSRKDAKDNPENKAVDQAEELFDDAHYEEDIPF